MELIISLLSCVVISFIIFLGLNYYIKEYKRDKRIKYYYSLKHTLGESRAIAWLKSGKPIPNGMYIPKYRSGRVWYINVNEIKHFYKENGIEW